MCAMAEAVNLSQQHIQTSISKVFKNTLTISLDALDIEPVKESFQQPDTEHTAQMHATLRTKKHTHTRQNPTLTRHQRLPMQPNGTVTHNATDGQLKVRRLLS